jgi:hypothetical protein
MKMEHLWLCYFSPAATTTYRNKLMNLTEVTPKSKWLTVLCFLKLSLCFNWAPRHEGVLGEWRYSSTHSLTSALDGGEWSASRPGRFTPRKRAPGTHWIGGWVGPRAVLDVVVKRKIPSHRRESNPRTPIVQPVAQRYTDWNYHGSTPTDVDNFISYFLNIVKLHLQK